jgi:hypothetical protein
MVDTPPPSTTGQGTGSDAPSQSVGPLPPNPDLFPNLKLRPWAARLRDQDERWQKLSQDGVQLFMGLIMDQSCCARWSVSLHTPFQMNLSVEQFPMMPSLRPTMTTLSVG